MSVVDIFAGPGGWSEGVRMAGLECVGLEWDMDACRTRVAAGHRTVRADVSVYPPEPFTGSDGLIASPPCQAFSQAGERKGIDDLGRIHAAIEACRDGWAPYETTWEDERSRFILEPLRWAWTIRPIWIACEQVPPCLSVWEHMANVLRSWGYSATAVKLNSADWGVPQTRVRAFLLAHRDTVRVAEPTHAKHPEPGLFSTRLPWVSMAEALGWDSTMPPVPDGGAPPDQDRPDQRASGSGRESRPGAAQRFLDRRVAGYSEGLRAVPDDEPAPTLSLSNGREVWTLRGRKNEVGWVQRRDSGPAAERTPRHIEEDLSYTIRADASGKAPGGVTWVRTSFGEPHRGKEAGSPKPEFERPCRTVNTKTGDWVRERPATTVQSTDRIGKPGTKDFEGGEAAWTDSIPITQEEAAILQGFRPDYPFQGTKTSRFRQIGNAVPPTWAAAILGALAGKRSGRTGV